MLNRDSNGHQHRSETHLQLGLILDLRPTHEFHAGHVAHAYHISPLTELKSRYSYLPPRGQSFLVLANLELRVQVLDALKDHNAARFLFLSADEETELDEQVLDREDFLARVSELGLLRSSRDSSSRLLCENDTPTLLFQPSAAVQRLVEHIDKDGSDDLSHRRVLDLGCGAARDLAWILHRSRSAQAQTTRSIWHGVGLDNWKATLDRAQQLMLDLGLTPPLSDLPAVPSCEALLWANCSQTGALVPLTGTGKGKAISVDTKEPKQIDVLHTFDRLALNTHAFNDTEPRYDLVICVRFYPWPTLLRLGPLIKTDGYVLISHFVSLNDQERAIVKQTHVGAIIDYDSPPHQGRIQPGQIETLLAAWNTLESGECCWAVHQDVFEPIEDGRLVRSFSLRKHALNQLQPQSL